MECRYCGHERKEAAERVQRLGSQYDLCDVCACVGKICASSNVAVTVGELEVNEFTHMMRAILRECDHFDGCRRQPKEEADAG